MTHQQQFWFKNLMTYRLTAELTLNDHELNEQLQAQQFTACAPTDRQKFGWSPPLNGSDMLYFAQGKQYLFISHKEEKILPANIVKKESEEQIIELEKKEQRKLKKAEKQAIKETLITKLLPRAFSKHQFTAIWLDLEAQLVYIDTASSKRAEDTLALLRKTLGSLPVVPLSFVSTPADIMTSWVEKGDTPSWLELQDEAELKDFNTDSIIRCKRQDLESEEIATHLQAGKLVTKLALNWESHFSFVLNEDATLSRLKFSDTLQEKNERILKEDYAQQFDADFLLMTEEIRLFMQKLTDALGEIKRHIGQNSW